VSDLCDFFAIVGVNESPLQTEPSTIQVPSNWFDQGEDVVVLTPRGSFNRLIKAVTANKLAELNTLDLEDPTSLNKSFKPRKVIPIPPNDKIPGVSCRIVVLCDKQRQVRIHLPGSMFQTLMAAAG